MEMDEFKLLKLQPSDLNPVLFKQLESKMTAVVWEVFGCLNSGSRSVEISGKDNKAGKLKNDSLKCKLPLPDNTMLPCVSQVHAVPQKGGYVCASLFGVFRPHLIC